MANTAEQTFKGWQQALGKRDWQAARSYLAPNVTYNGNPIQEAHSELAEVAAAAPDIQSEIDTLVVGNDGLSVAARIIHRATLVKSILAIPVTGQPVEWTEHIMLWVSDDDDKLISRILALVDTQHQSAETVPRTPSDLQQRPPPVAFNLDSMYRSYLAAINSPTIADNLPTFYQPNLVHTAKDMTIKDLADFLEASPKILRDLNLSATDLIVDDASQQIAARIQFDGTPLKPFFGIDPPTDGRAVRFYEHAFYKLDGGKFKFIWAMMDLVGYQDQVGKPR